MNLAAIEKQAEKAANGQESLYSISGYAQLVLDLVKQVEHLRAVMQQNDLVECPKCGFWSPSNNVCWECGHDPDDKEQA